MSFISDPVAPHPCHPTPPHPSLFSIKGMCVCAVCTLCALSLIIISWIDPHSILYLLSVGSPADRADLEIGDEILEVNGKSLDGATHTEVISHIHQVK